MWLQQTVEILRAASRTNHGRPQNDMKSPSGFVESIAEISLKIGTVLYALSGCAVCFVWMCKTLILIFVSRCFVSATVDPLTFEEFYKCWKQNEIEIRQFAISDESHFDPRTDSIIKVSGLVKCTCGSGRIILTQERQVYLLEIDVEKSNLISYFACFYSS
jgi:hypothetical protein